MVVYEAALLLLKRASESMICQSVPLMRWGDTQRKQQPGSVGKASHASTS